MALPDAVRAGIADAVHRTAGVDGPATALWIWQNLARPNEQSALVNMADAYVRSPRRSDNGLAVHLMIVMVGELLGGNLVRGVAEAIVTAEIDAAFDRKG